MNWRKHYFHVKHFFLSFQSHHDFKTPLVEGLTASPQGELPQIEGEEGSKLLHTVSFYRKQRAANSSSASTPHEKIVRRAEPMIPEEEDDPEHERNQRENMQMEIRKLQVRERKSVLKPLQSRYSGVQAIYDENLLS